jgi:hypothetical protein
VRRGALVLVLLGALALPLAGAGSAAAAPEWASAQPETAGGRTPLGPVGDLECWSTNRCLLITGGVEGAMPAGLYAYDGNRWYLYSTVCGGKEGRIAWVGPDDFWTVSDQQPGQEGLTKPRLSISLCHFKDSAVVASYAEPVGVAGSYLQMSAAACNGPEECWFGGEKLPLTAPTPGAFHLFWNGLSLNTVPSLTTAQTELEDPSRKVVGLAYHDGSLYESVRAEPSDEVPQEEPGEPVLLHRVVPGIAPSFLPVHPSAAIADPEGLAGFRLSDGGAALWAVSGAASTNSATQVAVLRLAESSFEPVSLVDPTEAFEPGDEVTGLAAEPGGEAAWIGIRHATDSTSGTINPPARLALVHADGTVDAAVTLPAEGRGVSNWGKAGPIACPAEGQCWMATAKGWLFHLGGPPAEPNEDPAFHTLVTYRPPDNSLPVVPPTTLPEDNSGAELERTAEPLPEVISEPLPERIPPLYANVHSKVVDGHILVLSFVLSARAHVRLLARRQGKVVARTKRYTLARGHRSVRLPLDPRRWPTKLDLQVHAVATKGKR